MKTRRHTVLLTVTFDKKCTRALALRELRDTIHGTEYCTQLEDHEPGEFSIRSIKPVPTRGGCRDALSG